MSRPAGTVQHARHLDRLEQMPPDKAMNSAELNRLWNTTNPMPTIRYLLNNDLCRWKAEIRDVEYTRRDRWVRIRRPVLLYYRPGKA